MDEHIHTKESLQIIKEVESSANLNQRQISAKLGISLGKTNYILKALIERGILKLKRFKNAQNKVAYLYFLTPRGIEEKARMAKKFLNIKIQEYETLKQEIEKLKKEVSGS